MPRDSQEPLAEPALEEWVLSAFGYEDLLDTPIGKDEAGNDVDGRNFLSTYHDPERRQHTEDLLTGFRDMKPSEEEYDGSKQHIARYLETWLGPPKTA